MTIRLISATHIHFSTWEYMGLLEKQGIIQERVICDICLPDCYLLECTEQFCCWKERF